MWFRHALLMSASKAEEILVHAKRIFEIMKNSVGVVDNDSCSWTNFMIAQYYWKI